MPKPGRAEQRDGAAGLGAEALHRREPGDLRAHRLHDAPAAEQRAEPHRRLAGDHNPERHVEFAAEHGPLREQQHGDDAHRLLRVVAAMAERIERSRDELQVAESVVDGAGRGTRNIHDTASTEKAPEKIRSSATARSRAPS